MSASSKRAHTRVCNNNLLFCRGARALSAQTSAFTRLGREARRLLSSLSPALHRRSALLKLLDQRTGSRTMWRHVVLSVLCLAGCALASRQLIESQMCVIGELPPGERFAWTYVNCKCYGRQHWTIVYAGLLTDYIL